LGKKTNVLLVKDDVGKAKPFTRDLPSEQFAFGKHDLLPDRETTDQVVRNWRVHQSSHITKQDPRDFKKLNKMSLKTKAVTAHDQYNFRTTHDARIPFGLVQSKPTYLPNETFTFGRRNRPPTPVHAVIANYFGYSAGDDMQQRY